jgi:hypothetical protein
VATSLRTPPGTRADAAALEENRDLIESDRVEGTPVYRSNGDHIGHIERIMIEKVSGKATYAIMHFGGFLGMGEEAYPLPWSVLTYNPSLGGYEVNVSDEQLKSAPAYGDEADWADRNYGKRVSDHYGVPPYWL